jgi:hypothetical protein
VVAQLLDEGERDAVVAHADELVDGLDLIAEALEAAEVVDTDAVVGHADELVDVGALVVLRAQLFDEGEAEVGDGE